MKDLVFPKKLQNKGNRIVITRVNSELNQTLGIGVVLDVDYNVIFDFVTLELNDLNNKRNVSCIPFGSYYTTKAYTQKLKSSFHLNYVAFRYGIFIHAGNFNSDSSGCILVGSKFKDINFDDTVDIVESRNTIDMLTHLMPNNFLTVIK